MRTNRLPSDPIALSATASPVGVALLCAWLAAVAWAGDTQASSEAPPPSGALVVTTSPPEADVYVDGVPKGKSPQTIEGLTAGQHELRVSKRGYVPRVQLLELPADAPLETRVELAPDKTLSRRLKGGLGGVTWGLIGATPVALLLASSAVEEGKSNRAPESGSIGVAISTDAPALAGLTEVTLTAEGFSDPDGDRLTYTWYASNSQTVLEDGRLLIVTFDKAGRHTVTLEVRDDEWESANASVAVDIVDLAGTWQGTFGGGRQLRLTLGQNGLSVGGDATLDVPSASCRSRSTGHLSGRVSQSWTLDLGGNFKMECQGMSADRPVNLVCQLESSRSRCTGQISLPYAGPYPIVLRRN